MEQQVLNPVIEMMLVIIEEKLVLGKIGYEPLVFDEQLMVDMINDEQVFQMTGVEEEVNRIVEQLVKAVGDTEIDCTEVDDCCSMEVFQMTGVEEDVNRIVEQLVKAVGDTEIDCTEVDDCCSME
nr:hypothetical protein [Tanacetum cinerariifolium]